MPRIPRLAAYAAVFALALSASACSEVQKTSTESSDKVAGDVVTTIGIGDKEIKEGGTLTMGLSADPDALDPTTSSSLYTRYVMETVCQKLYDIDADGGIVPMLATALPELSEGGLVATFPVKEGVKFADGTPFDAAAVVTTLKRNLTKPDSSRASELGTLSEVEASGPYEVRLTFKEPFSPLTASLPTVPG